MLIISSRNFPVGNPVNSIIHIIPRNGCRSGYEDLSTCINLSNDTKELVGKLVGKNANVGKWSRQCYGKASHGHFLKGYQWGHYRVFFLVLTALHSKEETS